jgi:transcription antitermination factor NusG
MTFQVKAKKRKNQKSVDSITHAKYLILNTKENKEFCVKSHIISMLKGVDIVVPLIKSSVFHKEKEFMIYERITPDYMMISLDKVNDFTQKECIEKIIKIEDVVGFVTEKNSKNEDLPTVLSPEEMSEMTKFNGKYIINKKNDVIITTGQYAGFRARIRKVENDSLIVTVFIKDNPNTIIPIWNVGQEVL